MNQLKWRIWSWVCSNRLINNKIIIKEVNLNFRNSEGSRRLSFFIFLTSVKIFYFRIFQRMILKCALNFLLKNWVFFLNIKKNYDFKIFGMQFFKKLLKILRCNLWHWKDQIFSLRMMSFNILCMLCDGYRSLFIFSSRIRDTCHKGLKDLYALGANFANLYQYISEQKKLIYLINYILTHMSVEKFEPWGTWNFQFALFSL